MKVTYISHACLLIDTGKTLIATDPWFDGPAFCGQWNVFPRPVQAAEAEGASVYLISHPHEDHLHEATLRRLCSKPKRVFYPFYWYPETITWLRSLELGEVVEARSGRSYSIDENTNVNFIGAPGQNSIIAIESGGEVLINVNDALHSEPNWLIDAYVRQIKRRWPTIDAVFCGFGGASYYPNALHAPAKNDRAMARLREQLFIHNFCRIAHELAPRIAIPFAADFVLLAPHQRWINDVRFSREDIPAYYQQHFGQETVVHAMYPGDRLVDGTLEAVSPYRAQLQSRRLDHLIAEQYPDEVSAFRVSQRLRSDDEANGQWAVRLAAHLNSQVKFHPRRALEGLSFGVRLRDLQSRSCFNARWTGSVFEVTNGNAFLASSMANIETTTAVLETSIENDWGGDVLTIGYACDVTVLDSRAPGKVRLCVSLLTRYPRPKSYALTHPMRTMDYLYQSAPLVMARLKSKLRATINRSGEEEVITSPQWLTGNVETIRQACRLPVLPDF